MASTPRPGHGPIGSSSCLIVTALGGLLGGLLDGIVGLILAVPAWVIAGNAITRLRSRGVVDLVAERAQPAVQHLLG